MSNSSSSDSPSRGRLYFCVGLPRSGKSNYCDRWARTPPVSFASEKFTPLRGDPVEIVTSVEPIANPRAIVCGDDFRTALYGEAFRIQGEGTVFAMMDVAARALLARGFDVIIDETCTTEATLLRYLRLDIDARPVFIDTPANVCVERAGADRKYLLGPIARMARQLEHLRANWDETYARLRAYLHARQFADAPP